MQQQGEEEGECCRKAGGAWRKQLPSRPAAPCCLDLVHENPQPERNVLSSGLSARRDPPKSVLLVGWGLVLHGGQRCLQPIQKEHLYHIKNSWVETKRDFTLKFFKSWFFFKKNFFKRCPIPLHLLLAPHGLTLFDKVHLSSCEQPLDWGTQNLNSSSGSPLHLLLFDLQHIALFLSVPCHS